MTKTCAARVDSPYLCHLTCIVAHWKNKFGHEKERKRGKEGKRRERVSEIEATRERESEGKREWEKERVGERESERKKERERKREWEKKRLGELQRKEI